MLNFTLHTLRLLLQLVFLIIIRYLTCRFHINIIFLYVHMHLFSIFLVFLIIKFRNIFFYFLLFFFSILLLLLRFFLFLLIILLIVNCAYFFLILIIFSQELQSFSCIIVKILKNKFHLFISNFREFFDYIIQFITVLNRVIV